MLRNLKSKNSLKSTRTLTSLSSSLTGAITVLAPNKVGERLK
jgi:hypothetical protein